MAPFRWGRARFKTTVDFTMTGTPVNDGMADDLVLSLTTAATGRR